MDGSYSVLSICISSDQPSLPSLNKNVKGISSSSGSNIIIGGGTSTNNKKLLKSSVILLPESSPSQSPFLPVDHPPQSPPHGSSHANSSPTSPSMLLGGLLGACVVTASIVSVAFFLCLRRRLMKLDSSGGTTSSSSGTSSGGSPTCLLRHTNQHQQAPADHHLHPHLHHHTSWLSPSDLVQKGDKDMGPNNPFAKDVLNPYEVNTGGGLLTHNNTFWNDISKSTGTFGSNGTGGCGTRGADVSPYAYAHVVFPPHLPSQPPPSKSVSSSAYQGGSNNKFHYAHAPPTLIEWYSSSNGVGGSSEGHIYANHMYTFGGGVGVGSGCGEMDKEYKDTLTSSNTAGGSNSSGVMRENNPNNSTLGSLVHIDGFQCRKKAMKEKDVVERFL